MHIAVKIRRLFLALLPPTTHISRSRCNKEPIDVRLLSGLETAFGLFYMLATIRDL